MNLLKWKRSHGRADAPDRPQSRFASEEDIYFCFRLLLGRAPGPKEWYGHRQTAGLRVDEIVAKFLSSPEFAGRKLAVSSLASSEHQLVEAQGFRFYISAEDKVCASLRATGEYEPAVTALLRRILRPGMNFVDVGANIGFFSILAASLVHREGRVFAVEPYPYNVKMLLANLALNGCDNVEVLPFAVSRSPQLYRYDDSAGNSGQIFEAAGTSRNPVDDCLVYAMPLDRLIPTGAAVHVIKMDIEGAEALALQGMQRICSQHRPMVLSELAADFLRDVSHVSLADYVAALLIDDGYRLAIIRAGGVLEQYQRDVAGIVAAYERSAAMCLDVVAYPETLAPACS